MRWPSFDFQKTVTSRCAVALVLPLITPGILSFRDKPIVLVTSESEPPAATEPNHELRYNEMHQKSIHNAYDRNESLVDQLVYHHVRSLELDVHTSRLDAPVIQKDWYVYHERLPLFDATSCLRLSDCLSSLRAFHRTFPEHDVITVFLDIKDPFDANHTAEQLDRRLLAELDPSWIFRPSDLLEACPSASTLRDAVHGSCTWPDMAALQGKFLFVLTGGHTCGPEQRLNAYTDQGTRAENRTAFIAPDLHSDCPWSRYLNAKPEVIFFNMNYEHRDEAVAVNAAGLIGRVYYGGLFAGGLDRETTWKNAEATGAQFLATDKVNGTHDPWATTHSLLKSWPFSETNRQGSPSRGHGALLRASATSCGNRTGKDSYFFRYDRTTATDLSWSALVAVPSSHASRDALGCLMARKSEEMHQPFFAVCRPADDGPPLVLSRDVVGVAVRTTPLNQLPNAGLSAESYAFVRLDVVRDETGATLATGSASADGTTWAPIGHETFAHELPLQGIAVNSNDDQPAKFFFGDLHHPNLLGNFSSSKLLLPGEAKIGRCDRGESAEEL